MKYDAIPYVFGYGILCICGNRTVLLTNWVVRFIIAAVTKLTIISKDNTSLENAEYFLFHSFLDQTGMFFLIFIWKHDLLGYLLPFHPRDSS